MPSLAEQYTSEIYSQRGYWAAWEPNVHLRLGTCGPVQQGVFRPEGHLTDFGIKFSVERDPAPSDTDYSSRQGFQTTFQTKAGVKKIPNIPRGTAGMQIVFSRKEAAVVAVKGGLENRIANQSRLRQQLLESANSVDGIPAKWFVITHLVECAFASVIVAQGGGAKFEVSAQGDLAAGLVDLANVQLGFTVEEESYIGYKMLAEQGATPLFRGLRVKRKIFGGAKLETLGPATPDSELNAAFEEITPETTQNRVGT